MFQILATITEQLATHPDFSLVTVGHSLGGSIAILAAMTLFGNFPDNEVRCYSYGAPRTGVGFCLILSWMDNKCFSRRIRNLQSSSMNDLERAPFVVSNLSSVRWVPLYNYFHFEVVHASDG